MNEKSSADGCGGPQKLDHVLNASGKTAAMIALSRVFGETRVQRLVNTSDFHLKPGENVKDKPIRNLTIDCKLTFPELTIDSASSGATIPEVFNQMVVDEPGALPYCRIRMEATWSDDGTPTGDISQDLWWILTSSNDPKVIENGNRRKVLPGDRGKIRVLYVPAARNPDQQIKTT
nr:hypothetical protein [uncultured Desulfobacter sp.]